MSWWNNSTWVPWEPLGGMLDGGLAIDNSFADRANAAAPHTGVHIAALSGAVVHVRCWESYCDPGGWTGIGGAFQAPLAIANYGDVPVLAISANNLYNRTYGP